MTARSKKKLKKLDIAERMVPEFHSGTAIYGEHYIRYVAAEPVVKDRVVLDIASGSGYGSQLLAKHAKKVIGVDISEEAVEYAREVFAAKNVEYRVGDGESIPLEDGSVDVVVCFETIEHVPDYRTFMREVSRVLKKDGLLLLSTPNELEFTEGNHYHLHEFEEKELEDLVRTEFKNIKSYYQGDWIYSGLLPKEKISKQTDTFAVPTFNLAPIKPEKYLYFYMLCSNRKITESIEPIGALSEHWSARLLNEQQVERDRVKKLTDDHVRNLEAIRAEQEAQIQALQARVGELQAFANSKLGKLAHKAQRARRRINRSGS